MKKKPSGKMSGLKPGKPSGKSKVTAPFFAKVKDKDGDKMAKGGKVNCYAKGGVVQMKSDYSVKDGGPSASGNKVSGVARGMGAAKRGGNFEY